MPDIPSQEPTVITAGDTIKWTKSLGSDYPATTYTLKYRLHLRNAVAAEPITITAAADGADYSITVAAATSAAYTAGEYDWYSWVESGTERYSIDSGRLTIKPDPEEVAAGTDLRSHAEKMLDLIETVLESGATSDQKRIKINDREIEKYTFEELLDLREYYKKAVEAEHNEDDIAAGRKTGGRYLMEL